MAAVDWDFLRSFVSHKFGPEVAAVFKHKDLLEFRHRGREAPLRMCTDILKIGAKRAKEQHAPHGKRRKHQISKWVPLDLMTIQLKGLIPDWAKLYPLHQHAESEEAGDDLPNLWPPRVAAATYLALIRQADSWAHWVTLDWVEMHGMWCAYITSKPSTMLCKLPPIAKPYMKDEAWSWDLLQCFLRLADRICKGYGPQPRCTGEEIALHMMERHVQEIFETEADEPDDEWFKGVPVHKEDEHVDMWFAIAVQDIDIIFLYNGRYEGMERQGILDYIGAVNLDPVEWFIRFKNVPVQEPPLL